MGSKIVYRRILKKMGYKADQQGVINRYLREAGGWDPHLMNCREYILERVKLHSPATISILGSGWLLDVPLEELAELCNRVQLVDITHPPQIKKKAACLENVELINDDITGGMVKRSWQLRKNRYETIIKTEVPVYQPDYEPGLVISLNVLTQTDTLIVDYLNRKHGIAYADMRDLRERIQSAHLSYLDSVPSLLISDFEELIFDKDELVKSNKLLFTDLPFEGERRDWEWDFDNSGEYYKRKRICFKVLAIDNAK